MAINTIHVHELPECDFCGEPAPYDAPTTKRGRWANMCEKHYKLYGAKNIGSKREIIGAKKYKVKHYSEFKTFPPVAVVPLSMDSVVTVKCPWCKQGRRVEPDANYLVNCERCGNPYKLRSQI